MLGDCELRQHTGFSPEHAFGSTARLHRTRGADAAASVPLATGPASRRGGASPGVTAASLEGATGGSGAPSNAEHAAASQRPAPTNATERPLSKRLTRFHKAPSVSGLRRDIVDHPSLKVLPVRAWKRSATTLARGLPAANVPAANILSAKHLVRIRGGRLVAAAGVRAEEPPLGCRLRIMRKYLWVFFRGGEHRVSALSEKPPYGIPAEQAKRFGSNSYGAAMTEAARRNAAARTAKPAAQAPELSPVPPVRRRALVTLHGLLDPTARDAERARLLLALTAPTAFWKKHWPRRRAWGNRASLVRWMPAHALADVLQRHGRAVAVDLREGSGELLAALRPLAAKHGAAASRALAEEAKASSDGGDGVSAAASALASLGLVLLTLDTCSDDPVFVIASRSSLARARRAASAAKVVVAEAAS